METKQTLEALGIPDPLAPFHEKKEDNYGLKYALAIQEEWFNGGMITTNCMFMTRHDWIRKMRKFNRGENSIEEDKARIARQSEDLSLLNLNWERVNFSEKFVNIVRNGISDEYYRVDVRSADKFALLEKKKNRLQHKKRMYSKPMLEKAKELGFPDLTHKGFIPEDDEELRLYEQIKERPKQEIREEILINYVKQTSDWDFIKKQCAKDFVECSIGVARCETDPVNGIQLKYVDPESYGHSYVERNDFNDAYYHFVVDTVTIGDIKRESNGELEESELREIAKKYVADDHTDGLGNIDYDRVNINQVLKIQVHVMRFTFKTSKEVVYKKYHDKRNKVRKIAKRDTSYEVPEGAEKSKLSQTYDTWFEGNYVVGTNKYLYGYQESERIARDEQDRALPPFVTQSYNIYKNKLTSFLSNIKPLCDQLQYYHLMIQKLALELKPDLTVINLDQLAELDSNVKGSEKENVWKQALSILNVKGVIFEQTIDLGEEGVQQSQSARPQAVQQGSALSVLLNLWAHYYNLIRDITGINPARDGSLPADALVGVNQMMQLASNTATKHIVDAAVDFDKRLCNVISSRIKGIYSHKKATRLQKMYETALGKHNIDLIDGLKDRHLNDFGFYITMVSTKEEIDELKQSIAIAQQEGTIDVSEAEQIKSVAKTNIKQANEYMSFIRKRKIKEKMKQDAFNMRMQSKTNQEAAQAKTQGVIQEFAAKKQIELQHEAKLSAIRLREKQAEQQIEAPVKDKEFKQDVYMEQVKNLQTINLAKFKEEAKDDRLKEQSTHQSKLIKQRQENLPEFDFTNNFDIDSFLQQ